MHMARPYKSILLTIFSALGAIVFYKSWVFGIRNAAFLLPITVTFVAIFFVFVSVKWFKA
jgi:hypothetical protein